MNQKLEKLKQPIESLYCIALILTPSPNSIYLRLPYLEGTFNQSQILTEVQRVFTHTTTFMNNLCSCKGHVET